MGCIQSNLLKETGHMTFKETSELESSEDAASDYTDQYFYFTCVING